MDIRDTYKEIEFRIKRVNFTTLWSNFKPLAFTIFDDTKIYDGATLKNRNEDKEERYTENALIFLDGNYVVVYDVSKEDNLDNVAAEIIGLMYQGCQKINYESRGVSHLEGLINYKYDMTNLSIKYYENQLILELLDNYSNSKFNELMSIKKYRRNAFKYDFNYETSIEQTDGVMYYVKLNAMRYLNRDLYHEKLEEYKRVLKNSKAYIPVNNVSAISGCLLMRILFNNNVDFNTHFNQDFYIADLINGALDSPIHIALNDEITNVVRSFNNECNAVINKTVIKNRPVLPNTGVYKLEQINTSNAKYLNGYLISKLFITYSHDNESKVLFGDFVIKVNKDLIIDNVYQI